MFADGVISFVSSLLGLLLFLLIVVALAMMTASVIVFGCCVWMAVTTVRSSIALKNTSSPSLSLTSRLNDGYASSHFLRILSARSSTFSLSFIFICCKSRTW